MQNYDIYETQKVRREEPPLASQPVSTDHLTVTVFDGAEDPRTYELDAFGKDIVTFGRVSDDPYSTRDAIDIPLKSTVASRANDWGVPGRFRRVGGNWVIEDRAAFGVGGRDPERKPSTNGLNCNNRFLTSKTLGGDEFIRIDDKNSHRPNGVLFIVATQSSPWQRVTVKGRDEITIGRDPGSDIRLDDISASRRHARVARSGDGYEIVNESSANGVVFNGELLNGRRVLTEKDIFTITNARFIFTQTGLWYCIYHGGISIDVQNVVVKRWQRKHKYSRPKQVVTLDDVSLTIRPGELIAIVGGSGAGKSTLLNAICGVRKPEGGDVFIGNAPLYKNYDALKTMIGYVPQSDIVYDDLTLRDMLEYTAKLRLPESRPEEREKAVNEAISAVDLTKHDTKKIKSLSGGQKKRASIAVELIAKPKLLFLDEPASGLDPGTERELMVTLRKMADEGRTVVLVTHSTLQLRLCDRVVFMGSGGRLCYVGSIDDAMAFFDEINRESGKPSSEDVVSIYNVLNDGELPGKARVKYMSGLPESKPKDAGALQAKGKRAKKPKTRLTVLISRCLKLKLNLRTVMLLVAPAALTWLLSLLMDDDMFKLYDMTNTSLFVVACIASFIGVFNAILEIINERNIIRREYMAGLSLTKYLLAKSIVLGLMCIVQSALVTLMLRAIAGSPEEGVMMPPMLEIWITTALTIASSSAMGLCLSSVLTKSDGATSVAILLIIPQILFSGVIFELKGVIEKISWFIVCRWSMEGYGTTANLNALETKLQREFNLPHEANSMYEFTKGHLLHTWLILGVITLGFLVLSRLLLKTIRRAD